MSAIAIVNYIYDSPRQFVIVLEDILIPLAEEKVIAKYIEALRKKGNPFPGTERWSLAAIPNGHICLIRRLSQRVVL